MRRDKINYYLDIAETVIERSTCIRRNYGAIIVKNDQIISTGYNGSPRGRKNCSDLGFCMREKMNVPRGERYELCRAVHAEQNCIIAASRNDTLGAEMFLVGKNASDGSYIVDANSCAMCKKLIINAGIVSVYIRDNEYDYRKISVSDWIENDDSLSETMGY